MIPILLQSHLPNWCRGIAPSEWTFHANVWTAVWIRMSEVHRVEVPTEQVDELDTLPRG
jgi:hypothetical protein